MPCRHDLSRETRKRIAVINLAILALKLVELSIIFNERRRLKARAALRPTWAETHRTMTERKHA